ncbi:MAG TPA: hypothetical protein VFP09_02950 [Desertimonas sp.]|nr:hypothetical protein [Desertimonas sp.]
MTTKSDEPAAQTTEEPEAQTVENVNGEVIDVACVNAHVVGVSLLGPGDPQTAESSEG